MDTNELREWAEGASQGPVESHQDRKLSLTSKLLRFRWNGGLAVAVGSESEGKVRINSILDGIAWFLRKAKPGERDLHVLVGSPARRPRQTPPLKEHLDAITTLAWTLNDGPRVRVWSIDSGSDPQERPIEPTSFTTAKPEAWNDLLMKAAQAPIEGSAAEIVELVGDHAFALYPKLTSMSAAKPWQMRLDGLDIGRVGKAGATLKLATRKYEAPGEPRATWREIVDSPSVEVPRQELDRAADIIHRLIQAWRDPERLDGALRHRQPEHALEAHVLSGRLALQASPGRLRPAVPFRSGMLAAAQFPTLWGDVTAPARYLDALLADENNHPWAVELKDQYAGGGHGAYLRHGVGQAVLYRHYIRQAEALDPWCRDRGLDRESCRAALAFPKAKPGTEESIELHRELARLFDVEVLEFMRPGYPEAEH